MAENRTDRANHALRRARELRGWSQEDVARLLDTNPFTVYRWESGRAVPSPHFRQKLCAAFGYDAEQLGFTRRVTSKEQETEISEISNASAEPLAKMPLTSFLPSRRQYTKLVGREKLIQNIKERLRTKEGAGSPAYLALSGLPGVGKTALTVELAHDSDLQRQFPDGVLWISLGPDPNVLTLLGTWASALGFSPDQLASLHDSVALGQAIRAHIGMRQILLIIDDAWKIEDALAFQVGGPQASHLLTTRFPLLAAQFAPHETLTVPELTLDDGFMLLQQLAPAMVKLEEKQAKNLVQTVGGLPLALILLGHYLYLESVSGQPRRIRAALTQLQQREKRLRLSLPQVATVSPTQTQAPSHSLQAAIALSMERLSQTARSVIGALAAFPPKPNSFSEEMAFAVCGLKTEPFFEALDTLCDVGLIESPAPERYMLHQTIADYAHISFNNHAVTARLVEYITSFVVQHKKDYAILQSEMHNILTAFEQMKHGSQPIKERAIEGLLAWMRFLIARGLYTLAEELLTTALTVTHDPAARCLLLVQRGIIAKGQGNYLLLEIYAKEAFILAEQTQRADQRGWASWLLAWGALQRGELESAQALFEQALYLAQAEQQHLLVLYCLLDTTRLTSRIGQYSKTDVLLQEALQLAYALDEQESILTGLIHRAVLAGIQCAYPQAEHMLQEALHLARTLGHQEKICLILSNLGTAALRQGHVTQAETYLQEGLATARSIGHRERICGMLTNLSDAALSQQHYEQAENYVQEGIALARTIGNQERLCALLAGAGELAYKQGKYEKADSFLQEAYHIAQQGQQGRFSDLLQIWGDVDIARQRYASATQRLQEAITIGEKLNKPDVVALATFGLARCTAAQGDQEKAQQLGREALQRAESIGHVSAHTMRQWLETVTFPN